MESTVRQAVWRQFGAAIDTLENAVHACPDALWSERTKHPQYWYWYLVYHTLFFLDLYLSLEGFAAPAPIGMTELDSGGVMPERVYTKQELLEYLAHGREKCRARIAALTSDRAAHVKRFWTTERTELEWMLYNCRHVQHHSAQLNLILRQTTDSATPWVGTAKQPLEVDS